MAFRFRFHFDRDNDVQRISKPRASGFIQFAAVKLTTDITGRTAAHTHQRLLASACSAEFVFQLANLFLHARQRVIHQRDFLFKRVAIKRPAVSPGRGAPDSYLCEPVPLFPATGLLNCSLFNTTY